MLEKDLEAKMGRWLKKHKCLWYKWVSPGCSGVPDRIVITPRGDVWFVELKTETGELSELQRVIIQKILDYGARVRVVRGEKDAFKFLREELAL